MERSNYHDPSELKRLVEENDRLLSDVSGGSPDRILSWSIIADMLEELGMPDLKTDPRGMGVLSCLRDRPDRWHPSCCEVIMRWFAHEFPEICRGEIR
jgi:hypothetical protein